AARICGFGSARNRRRCFRRSAAGTPVEQPGHAAIWHATAHWVLYEIGRVGEFISFAGPHEFFDGPDGWKDQGRVSRRGPTGQRDSHNRTVCPVCRSTANASFDGGLPAGGRRFEADARRNSEGDGK